MTKEVERGSEPRRFRLAMKPILIVALLAHAPILGLFVHFRAMPMAWVLLLFPFLAAALNCAMARLLSRVDVSETGLTLNRFYVMPWDQVEGVTPSAVLGLRYLKAYRKGRRWAWWFPLYLADEDGFRRAVIEMAPVRNPFRVFFETEAGSKA